MVIPWFSAGRAALRKVKCPHCGKEQVRGRKPPHEQYRCVSCHRLFDPDAPGPGRKKK